MDFGFTLLDYYTFTNKIWIPIKKDDLSSTNEPYSQLTCFPPFLAHHKQLSNEHKELSKLSAALLHHSNWIHFQQPHIEQTPNTGKIYKNKWPGDSIRYFEVTGSSTWRQTEESLRTASHLSCHSQTHSIQVVQVTVLKRSKTHVIRFIWHLRMGTSWYVEIPHTQTLTSYGIRQTATCLWTSHFKFNSTHWRKKNIFMDPYCPNKSRDDRC